MGSTLQTRYTDILRNYVREKDEIYLAQAAELGRSLLQDEFPPEQLGEIHQKAVAGLGQTMPDLTVAKSADLISAPFIEMLMAYGLIFREHQERHRLKEQLDMLFHAVNHSPVIVVVTDREGRIEYVNPRFTRITGCGFEEAWGRTPRSFLFGNISEDEFENTWREATEQQEWRREFLNRSGKDETFWCEIALSRVGKNSHSRYVLIAEDITQRKETEKELRRTNRELDAFVSNLSHDLRTSLTPIVGLSEFLAERYRGDLDDMGREALDRILNQSLSMVSLMEDLLTLARTGHLERPQEPVNVSLVVQRITGEFTEKRTHIQERTLPPVRIPETLLEQVFRNLIGNALRYASEGGPIEVGGERSGSRVSFFVRDHGPGIPVPDRTRIFEPFARGSTKGAKRGTGLGLAIVQKIARLYQGSVRVEETPGGGSTFIIELRDPPSEKAAS